MAALIVVMIFTVVAFGIVFGAFIRLSYAISWEDRRRGSLRLDAPSSSTQAARSLVGITNSRWQ